jgi:anti-sigma regulatory factor (Ser/Thr protein kinase)
MSKSQRTFMGRFENLAQIGEYIEEITAKTKLDENQRYAVLLAVDEAASNIIEHAYRDVEDGKIEMTVEHSPEKLVIIVHDEGHPFEPDGVKKYDVKVPLQEMQERGAGLHLIGKIMDEVDFDFKTDGGNTLRMVKILG